MIRPRIILITQSRNRSDDLVVLFNKLGYKIIILLNKSIPESIEADVVFVDFSTMAALAMTLARVRKIPTLVRTPVIACVSEYPPQDIQKVADLTSIVRPLTLQKLQQILGSINQNVSTENKDHKDIEVNASLAVAMIRNIEGFILAINSAIAEPNAEEFAKACHKMKTTYALLDNDRLSRLSDEFLGLLKMDPVDHREHLQLKYITLIGQCREDIADLKIVAANG